MATVPPSSVDIAGSAWPVYKLEALTAGLAAFLILALITMSPQAGVLAGAALASVRWAIGATAARRTVTARGVERVLSAH